MLDLADRARTTPLRERNKQEKRARILAAARELFGTRGFDATTMQQVAATARVAAGTLYLYAGAKEDLLVQVFIEELGEVVDRSFATVPAGADALTLLLHLYGAVVEHHAANRELSRPFAKELLFVGEARRPQMRAFMGRWMARTRAELDRIQRRGGLTPDADTRQLAINSFGLFFYSLQSWLGGYLERDRLDTNIRAALEQLLTGHQTPAA